METNEVKKYLYRVNPMAQFQKVHKGIIHYFVYEWPGGLRFEIPVSDIGDAPFEDQMESKYLIRWLQS